MNLVIDASIIISYLIGSKRTAKIINSILQLYAPEYLFEEIDKHMRKIEELSKYSQEISKELKKLRSKIKIFPKDKFEVFISKADELLSDKKDIPYLALALKLNCSIWSNDVHFKDQVIIKTYTTTELLDELNL